MIAVEQFDTIDSTSVEAARRAASGTRGPLWLRADAQTSGRGRAGRDWTSPSGNLHATLLIPVEDDPGAAALRSFVACLAVADTLDTLVAAPDRVRLKWPNDALLDGRKVAGVLLESGVNPAGRWLSVGIGMNLVHAPETARWPTTSIATATGDAAPSPEATLAILAAAFEERERDFTTKGFDTIRTAWLLRAARLGEEVEARLPQETVTGIFETLDAGGAMLLQTSTGPRRISAADIHFPGGR